MNTWIKNPQDPADDHDWVTWFADPSQFRDTRFNIHPDGVHFSTTTERTRSHG